MSGRRRAVWVVSAVVLATIGATPVVAQPASGISDPFAYCAAVGTIDAPDRRYTGPNPPEPVARAVLYPGLPSSQAHWRCMNGQVYGCIDGASVSCDMRVSSSTSANQGMIEFCRDNPDSDFIPLAFVGHYNAHAWRCDRGVPAIFGDPILHPDARGFAAEMWRRIAPP